MMKRSASVLTVALMLAGCAGTRVPKLAKCEGPYRYANTYGTVLPSLPIPGQQVNAPPSSPPASSPEAPPAPAPSPVPAPNAGTPPPPGPGADQPPPARTSAVQPYYPSC